MLEKELVSPIALLAAKAGHKVIAISRNISALNQVEGITPYAVDLSNEHEITAFVNALEVEVIDVLINNAGVNQYFFEGSDF